MSRFFFKTRRFSFLHHQVPSPSAGYLVRWRDGKAKSHFSPSKRKQHLFKSHLCCAYWSQTWYCIQPCFTVYTWCKIKLQTRPRRLSFSVSQHIQLTLRYAGLLLRQGGFGFSTIKFLRHQLAILFFEEMAKRKIIVFPVNENNTFLKVIHAVHIDPKLDYAFNFVLKSTRGTRSNARLDPIL